MASRSRSAFLSVTVVALALMLSGHTNLRADSSVYANQWIDVNGVWASGGGNFVYLTNIPGYGYYVEWTGTGWWSAVDHTDYAPLCCGYGTHARQTSPGSANSYLYMQDDGNLILWDGGTPKWYTATYGNPGAYLRLQDDGNLVIRSSSNTAHLLSTA